jgi:vancomycin resistance protein YoaR
MALGALEDRVLGRKLRLRADDLSLDVAAKELGVRLDCRAMWEDAAGRRSGEGYLAYLLRTRRPGPRAIELRLTYDSRLLDELLAEFGTALWRMPRNAYIDPVTGVVVPEAWGRRLDMATTRQRLVEAWRSGATSVAAVTHRWAPATTSAGLAGVGVGHVLGRFSTYFDVADTGRQHNIRIAAHLLQGVVVPAGGGFSFNDAIGPRTLERGFRSAPEIVNQELVAGIGGGVCQVSSTLYNAALLSGAEITKRQNHSRPLGYVPPGRDAAVYYGAIDLQFLNPHGFPIVIFTEVVENRLTIVIRGSRALAVQYAVVVSEAEELPAGMLWEDDLALPLNQVVTTRPGRAGLRSDTWRVAYDQNGQETLREHISADVYPPQPALLRANPGASRPEAARAPG